MDQQTISQLLTEEELRERMSQIARNFPVEREALRKAYAALARREAQAKLAIKFMEISILENPKAVQYLATAKAQGVKITESDKEALCNLELESLKENYDLAKFDCETSEKDYNKLQGLLSWYQSMKKLQ